LNLDSTRTWDTDNCFNSDSYDDYDIFMFMTSFSIFFHVSHTTYHHIPQHVLYHTSFIDYIPNSAFNIHSHPYRSHRIAFNPRVYHLASYTCMFIVSILVHCAHTRPYSSFKQVSLKDDSGRSQGRSMKDCINITTRYVRRFNTGNPYRHFSSIADDSIP
jgi:hypothetical protein